MSRFPRILACLAIAAFAAACATGRTPHPTLQATLWVQTAAEYRALTEGTYNEATESLDGALADSTWTAAVEQTGEYAALPPAVIVDIDETVLDNSAFQARVIRQGGEFDPELWDAWIAEAAARPIPGALEFTREADRRGVTVFYVTNREQPQEAATRRNLEDLGFPLAAEVDVVLTRGEREEWESDKTTRRAAVATEYRILLLAGDDLNDFVDARISRELREELVRRHEANWGEKWFVLPNPVYGSWEGSILGYESALSVKERERVKREALETLESPDPD